MVFTVGGCASIVSDIGGVGSVGGSDVSNSAHPSSLGVTVAVTLILPFATTCRHKGNQMGIMLCHLASKATPITTMLTLPFQLETQDGYNAMPKAINYRSAEA